VSRPPDRAREHISALYAGAVTHRRLRPAPHRLRYRAFSLLLDLDELPALAQRLRLFSLNRFNRFSLYERDYGLGVQRGLRGYVESQLLRAGLPAGGAIHLLTMPRILGYAFNPLSVYFCHAADGALKAILYEVNNTFGERHRYLIAVDATARRGRRIVQRCAKQFHVSPFLAPDMNYLFRLEPPAVWHPTLSIGVVAQDADGPVLDARFDARRRRLGDATLARVFVTHPLLTPKVVAGIHWEGLRLLAKGLRPRPKPASPARSVTVVRLRQP
jgi:uncharacterized protein